MARPIRGKRSKLTRNDLFEYFATERLKINERTLSGVEERFQSAFQRWDELLDLSFLSSEKKAAYVAVIAERKERLHR